MAANALNACRLLIICKFLEVNEKSDTAYLSYKNILCKNSIPNELQLICALTHIREDLSKFIYF